MGHDHSHPHDHTHTHTEPGPDGLDPVLDLSIPDAELAPAQLARRGFLTRAGILGAGLAGATVLPGGAAAFAGGRDDHDHGHGHGHGRGGRAPRGGYQWLAGDHHIHTQSSSDAQYRVADQVKHGSAYGLDWMVITDHGSVAHAKIGVDKVNPDIVAAREEYGGETLVFQGLEWNIPAAEHGTVFVHPGANEVAVLKEFENSFDGVVNSWTASSSANEAHALDGLDFLAASVTKGRVKDAMFFANHPARKGLDSPHEIRGWRERQPDIALGMEGAPGHQAAGLPNGAKSGRGFYDNTPSKDSFAGYPLASYITYGGFDWMTSTVGGLWDSLLAEGRPWWITANSDSHTIYLDDSVRGPIPGGGDATAYFNANGRYPDPVHGGTPNTTNGDFWPGYYSRTHVGATRFDYASVMSGLRAGRVWVDHGSLVSGVDVRVRESGSRDPGYPLGSAVEVRRGKSLELVIAIDTQDQPNWAQFVPALAKVDVIQGGVTGPATDKDAMAAPSAKVVKTFDVTGRRGQVVLTYQLGRCQDSFYLRVRGSDGKRLAAGLNGSSVDAAGPAADVFASADPWNDLWFYTNPIWVLAK